jgi:hypothetical protein
MRPALYSPAGLALDSSAATGVDSPDRRRSWMRVTTARRRHLVQDAEHREDGVKMRNAAGISITPA